MKKGLRDKLLGLIEDYKKVQTQGPALRNLIIELEDIIREDKKESANPYQH